MKKLTREIIEEFGNKVVELCKKRGYGDTCVYFNGKRIYIGYGDLVIPEDANEDAYFENIPIETEEDCHPGDYFEYYNHNHILSMSFEGDLYDILNYGNGSRELEKLFDEYGVYYELGNAWNLSVYPIDDDIEVDGIKYEEKKKPIYVYRHKEYNPPELQKIMDWWYEASEKTGDIGSCVIGAGFNFAWNGDEYFMGACSPWQGSLSWERHIDAVKLMLELIGATNVWFNYGILD